MTKYQIFNNRIQIADQLIQEISTKQILAILIRINHLYSLIFQNQLVLQLYFILF